MKRILQTTARAVFAALVFLLYPIVALPALPWALFDTAGTWGHTTFKSWKEGFIGLYSLDSLKALVEFVQKG